MLLILVAFFSAFSAFSQINKGQFLVGGSGSFSSNDQNNVKSTSVTLSPNAGYFFLNKLAGGVDLTLHNSVSKAGTEKNTMNGYGISPFVRYYVLPASNKINLFAEASYGWAKGKNKYLTHQAYTTTANSYSFSAGPAFFITPNLALEISAGYTQNEYRAKDNGFTSKSKEKLFQAGVGFQIHLGKGRK